MIVKPTRAADYVPEQVARLSPPFFTTVQSGGGRLKAIPGSGRRRSSRTTGSMRMKPSGPGRAGITCARRMVSLRA